MENTNMDKKCDDCAKGVCQGGACCGMSRMGMCGHGCHGGKHHLVKMILKIIIVILIFWCGFKLGEMTGFIKAQSGYGTSQRGGFGMMRGYNNNVVPPTSATQ